MLPLAVAGPLAGAVAVMAFGRGRGQRAAGPTAMLVAFATAGLLGWAALRGADPVVHWFAGWRPADGIVPGIAFVGGPLAMPLAALAAGLVGVALLYSGRYFDEVSPAYPVLMLTFLAGMTGFVLTGDGFNLFVFYELIGVSAYALTGYVIQHEGPLQGAVNFAVSNTIGGLLVLSGVAFLYVATGTPNFAAAGAAVADGADGPAVIAAFVLLLVGLFVKAAIVPFHFWHADAHAVAPTPVCVLFAGVMIQLGVFVFARVHWVVFEGLWQAHQDTLRMLLLVIAAVTAIVAAVMTVLQTHLKRLLAFSSVSHVGVALAGVAMLDHVGLAGSALYVSSHAAVKAALFMCVGILLRDLHHIDEHSLHGAGARRRGIGVLFAVGGLALAGLPPFGLSIGKELIEQSAAHHHLGVLVVTVLVVTGALTGGAVLRAGLRIFLGWGEPAHSDETSDDTDETTEERAGTTAEGDGSQDGAEPGADQVPTHGHPTLWGPAAALLVGALGVGAVPSVRAAALEAAQWFTHPEAYRALVLAGEQLVQPAVPSHGYTTKGVLLSLLTVLLAVGLAVAATRRTGRRGGTTALSRALRPVVAGLHAVHSGHVGDYVTWIVVGLALSGILVTAVLT